MDMKKLGKKLLFPPLWLMIVLIVISAAALVTVFLRHWEETAVAYAVYVLAFYTLSVFTLYCVMVLPGKYRSAKEKVLNVPLANRYAMDRVFRTRVSLHLSLAVNLLYAATNVLFWHLYRSWWFVCLAVYYATLSVMRFLLVRYVRIHEIGSNRSGELKRALACGYIMLLLNLFLSGAVLMMVYHNRGYAYHGMMIYVMAAYTFYMLTHAIMELIRHRRFESPVMAMARGISMAAALVSMLNLETAMFAQFGQTMAQEDQRLMIILTGAGISIAVITMAVYTIVRCTKEMKRSKIHGA